MYNSSIASMQNKLETAIEDDNCGKISLDITFGLYHTHRDSLPDTVRDYLAPKAAWLRDAYLAVGRKIWNSNIKPSVLTRAFGLSRYKASALVLAARECRGRGSFNSTPPDAVVIVRNAVDRIHAAGATMPKGLSHEFSTFQTGRTAHPSALNRKQRRAEIRKCRREIVKRGGGTWANALVLATL